MDSHLCLFDLDKTLVEDRTVERLADHFGIGERLERLLGERGDRPAAGAEESAEVMRLFAGVDAVAFERVCAEARLRPGAAEAVEELQRMGFRVGVATASYVQAAEAVRDLLGLDFVAAAEPVVTEGRLTGELRPSSFVGPCGRHICKEQVLLDRRPEGLTVAVGDGTNDQCMLAAADVGIALAPCPMDLRLAADVVVHDLRAVPSVVQKALMRPLMRH